MPKMQIVTDAMLDRASRIGQASDLLFSNQNAVTQIFQNMGKDFSGRIPGLMTQHMIAMQSDYKSMNGILSNYKSFMEDAARNYEWTEDELARWAEALGNGDQSSSASMGVSSGNNTSNTGDTGTSNSEEPTSTAQNPTPSPTPQSESEQESQEYTQTQDTSTQVSTSDGEIEPGNFEKAMDIVFFNEGGYSNDPDDPGGATNMGITEGTLNRAYQLGIVSHNNVARLTQNEAMEIYRKMYWEPSNADKMPEPLATIYFDSVVLCGQYGGGRLLQKAMNGLGQSVVVDGDVGPQTLAALEKMVKTPEGIKALSIALCDARQQYHNGDPNAWKYLTGWTNRVNRMRALV